MKFKESVFFILSVLMVFNFVFGLSLQVISSNLVMVSRIVVVAILIITFVTQKRAYSQYLLLMLTLSIFFISFNFIILNVLTLLFLSFNYRKLSIKFVISSLLFICVMSSLIHLLGYYVGFFNFTETNHFSGRVRETFGFSNPNQLAVFYFSNSILAFIYLKEYVVENFLIKVLVISFLLLSISVIIYSDSRTSLFGLLIFLFVYIVRKKHHVKYLAALLPFSYLLFSLFSPVYNTPYMNDILSLRPSYFSMLLSDLSYVNYFVGFYEVDDIIIDNLYLVLLATFGLPFTFVLTLVGGYIITFVDCKFLPLIVALSTMSFFESFAIRPEVPITILLVMILTRDSLKTI
ncbi:MAG: hypothetical protein ACTH7Q_00780 [Pseudoalteromonas sp.]